MEFSVCLKSGILLKSQQIYLVNPQTCPSLSFSLYLSVCLSVCLCLSGCLSLSHLLSLSLSVDEVQKAVTNLKSGKACGFDHIHAEMLKTGGKDVILFMTKLFNTIFDKGIYPSDWAKAIIVPIHKKGDTATRFGTRSDHLFAILII